MFNSPSMMRRIRRDDSGADQDFGPEPIIGAGPLADLPGIVGERPSAERFRVLPLRPLGQSQQSERRAERRTLSDVVRHHLENDVGALRQSQQVAQLVRHDHRAADRPVQHCLVQDDHQERCRVRFEEPCLSTQPCRDPLTDQVLVTRCVALCE
ncbi:hypothetical protein TR51_16230 [Kitasatospora griseola]|uniref:Uncharacterized protein n=1 Tax=Kitasatospora griseola TaxID=2064 RepID=A0A0D0PS92_KITGR|nr:hypothetical protein TR51_16230 [Kitasatospora griseola]